MDPESSTPTHRMRLHDTSASSGGQSIRTSVFSLRSAVEKLPMQYQLEALVTCAAIFVFVLLQKRRRLSTIRDIPGPANPSWIFGMSPGGQPSMALMYKPQRTPVVSHGRRCWQTGEEVFRKFWERRPFERSLWGTPCLSSNAYPHLASELRQSVRARRRIACGSQTRRPSTTSFKNPVICTGNQPTFGNKQRC